MLPRLYSTSAICGWTPWALGPFWASWALANCHSNLGFSMEAFSPNSFGLLLLELAAPKTMKSLAMHGRLKMGKKCVYTIAQLP